jgi:hypothetical protein
MNKILKMIAVVFTQILDAENLIAEAPGVGSMLDRTRITADFESAIFIDSCQRHHDTSPSLTNSIFQSSVIFPRSIKFRTDRGREQGT